MATPLQRARARERFRLEDEIQEREDVDEDEEGRDGCKTLMLVIVWSVYVRFVLLRCEWRWRIKGFGV